MQGTWEGSAYESLSVTIPAPCHSCPLASSQADVLPGWGRVDTPEHVTWPALGDHLEKGSSPSGPTLADLKKQEGSSPGAEEAPVTTVGPQP